MALKSSEKIKCELKEDKKRIKVLETELTRTKKVLDEITALLMLNPTFAKNEKKHITINYGIMDNQSI